VEIIVQLQKKINQGSTTPTTTPFPQIVKKRWQLKKIPGDLYIGRQRDNFTGGCLVNYSALTDGASGRELPSHPEDPQGDSCFSEG
jgi:hypothetical protein